MRLGKVEVVNPAKVRIFNIIFVRDCRSYVKKYFKLPKNQDDIKRLEIIGEYIQNKYKTKRSILELILSLLGYIKISPTGDLNFEVGYVDSIPVEILYKTITHGTLSFKGVSLIPNSFKYAALVNNWRK